MIYGKDSLECHVVFGNQFQVDILGHVHNIYFYPCLHFNIDNVFHVFLQDIGAGKGKYYAVNFPLRDGINDDSYDKIFKPVSF